MDHFHHIDHTHTRTYAQSCSAHCFSRFFCRHHLLFSRRGFFFFSNPYYDNYCFSDTRHRDFTLKNGTCREHAKAQSFLEVILNVLSMWRWAFSLKARFSWWTIRTGTPALSNSLWPSSSDRPTANICDNSEVEPAERWRQLAASPPCSTVPRQKQAVSRETALAPEGTGPPSTSH